ncbi:MAG: hypothetical protein RLZZ387_2039 [Chloroflexota bacterium]
MDSTIPVILFAYARPDLLRRTLDALRSNDVPLIYAFSDGPRTPDTAAAVDEVRRMLRGIDWCEVRLVERSENLGLGRSVRDGVTRVLAEHEAAIVVEDDLICVPGTYAWMCAALCAYRDNPGVMSVSAWTHPRITPRDIADQPYFDGRAECWIWGTWARAWQGMDRTARELVQACEERGIDPYRYGADLMEMARIELERNIWAVRWFYLHILNGGLCVRPPWSMVEHIGFDPRATNAPSASGWNNASLRPAPPIPHVWPTPAEHPDLSRVWQRVEGGHPTALRSIARRAAVLARDTLYASARRLRAVLPAPVAISEDYTLVEGAADPARADGWLVPDVAERQDQAYRPLLREMYAGRPREDFRAAAEAVRATGLACPSLLEVGCGSGYYRDVLSHLLAGRLRYAGLDYSAAMTRLAARREPLGRWITGDATALPFPDGSFDIVMNGVSLMHIPGYRAAIAESRRVARSWCVFHTVPLLRGRPTATLSKRAYGEATIEIIFNEQELRELFAQSGLAVAYEYESIPYDLGDVLGEPTVTRTFVCEVAS